MRHVDVDITLAPDEPFHIAPYSDVHFDARECDRNGLERHYSRFAKLENPHAICIGDWFNLVLPGDLKRHTPDTAQEKYAAVQNYFNEVVDDSLAFIRREPAVRWDVFGMGNHESEALKHHHYDAVETVARRLGAVHGTYSGMVRYRIHRKGGESDSIIFRLLYHHGAWGGVVIQGLEGAKRWAAGHTPFHVMVFGHNHSSNDRPWPKWDHDKSIVWDERYVNTGTWLKTLSKSSPEQPYKGAPPDYSEKAGHPMVSLGTPIIKVWYERHRTVAGSPNSQRMELHYMAMRESVQRQVAPERWDSPTYKETP